MFTTYTTALEVLSDLQGARQFADREEHRLRLPWLETEGSRILNEQPDGCLHMGCSLIAELDHCNRVQFVELPHAANVRFAKPIRCEMGAVA